MPQNKQLLSSKEKSFCTKISSQNTLHGKRAKALLALNEGKTQIAAGEQSGLSFGQVKYILRRFSTNGLSVFSNVSLDDKPGKKVKEVKQKKEKKGKKMGKKKDKKKAKKKDKKSKKKKNKKGKKAKKK